MQITDIISQMGGIQSIARELGVSETEAARGADALAPAILGGFKKQAQAQPSGIEGLGGMLGQLGGGSLLDDVLAPQPTHLDRGNEVLGRIFGSKDVSRTVAQNAASHTGINPQLLKRMLPMVAMLVAGYMAKRGSGAGAQEASTGSGLGGGLLGGLTGQGRGTETQATGASASGAGGLASILDLDGDGNALDDIMTWAGKVLR